MSEAIYEESALKHGAVDFIAKSRGLGVLLKRVNLALTRSPCGDEAGNGGGGTVTIGALELNARAHRVLWKGQEVRLTVTEFSIVHLIASRGGTNTQFKEIHDRVHGERFSVGYGPDGHRANIRTFISRIRKKFRGFDEEFAAIANCPGFGYRWCQT